MITFAVHDLAANLPTLLSRWPENGYPTVRVARKVNADVLRRTSEGPIHVDHRITRAQLRKAGVRLAKIYSTPWKYTKYFQQGTNLRAQAIKLRPGATLAISINGNETTAFVEQVRRIRWRGNYNYLKASMFINTENLPLILDRESKCDCVFCGQSPKGETEACPYCGAPLPDC